MRSLIHVAVLTAAVLTACGTNDSMNPAEGLGSVRVQLTDAPFPFDSVAKVEVHVVRVDARIADADSAAADANVSDNSQGGWVEIARPDKVVELLALRGGKVADLGSTQVAVGTYRGLRLILDASKSSLTLKNGMSLTGASSPGVKFPSADKSGLKIKIDGGVAITEENATILVIDFDVGNSFVMRGNSITQNGLLFKPTLSATVK